MAGIMQYTGLQKNLEMAKIKNIQTLSGSTSRLVEIISIAKAIRDGGLNMEDFEPLDESDKRVMIDVVFILDSGDEPLIPNDIT